MPLSEAVWMFMARHYDHIAKKETIWEMRMLKRILCLQL